MGVVYFLFFPCPSFFINQVFCLSLLVFHFFSSQSRRSFASRVRSTWCCARACVTCSLYEISFFWLRSSSSFFAFSLLHNLFFFCLKPNQRVIIGVCNMYLSSVCVREQSIASLHFCVYSKWQEHQQQQPVFKTSSSTPPLQPKKQGRREKKQKRECVWECEWVVRKERERERERNQSIDIIVQSLFIVSSVFAHILGRGRK